jgi:hypothetical protein
MLGVS